MNGGLDQIIRSGKAPGVSTKAADPGSPTASVPRALRQMEEKESARRIAKQAGFSVNELKRIWNI